MISVAYFINSETSKSKKPAISDNTNYNSSQADASKSIIKIYIILFKDAKNIGLFYR